MLCKCSIDKWALGQKPQSGKTKFPNLLILEHLKNYFIEPINKFLMCFDINGLKNPKLNILRFLPRAPIYLYYPNSSKNIFIVKTPFIIYKFT